MARERPAFVIESRDCLRTRTRSIPSMVKKHMATVRVVLGTFWRDCVSLSSTHDGQSEFHPLFTKINCLTIIYSADLFNCISLSARQ